jgi:2-keto-4-pentenoate hydratase
MPHSNSVAAQAAAILAVRRRAGEPGPRLPEPLRPLDIDAALAIQASVTEQLGERIAAWKCGTPVEDRVVLAPIHAGTVHAASPCPVWAREGQVRIEPEIAFILGHDLPARDASYTPAEIDAAVARVHIALELIDSRYADPAAASAMEHLADGLLNQGLFIGPQVGGTPGSMAIRIGIEGDKDIDLDGRHPNADPRLPLYWLAEFLRSKGQGLQAGQAVITGSYAGTLAVPAGKDITVRFDDLGTLAVRLTWR